MFLLCGTADILPDDDSAEDKEFLIEDDEEMKKLGYAVSAAEGLFSGIASLRENLCESQPQNPCAGVGLALVCIPNPAYYFCRISNVVFIILETTVIGALTIAQEVVDKEFGAIGPNEIYYDYYYSRATYHNTKNHNEWHVKALEAIRVNMKDQHMQMKQQLQERHKDIANHVGQDVSCCFVTIFWRLQIFP
jgi:hypothetical protein